MVITPATETNRDPNHDKTLATSNNPPTKPFDCSGGLAAFRFFLTREHRELIDVKTISLGTSSTVSTVWSAASISEASYRERRLSDVLTIHQKVVKKVTQKGFPAIGGLHEDKLCDTLQATAPTK